jgi:hypothetical protein
MPRAKGTTPNRKLRSGRADKPFQPAIGTDFGRVADVEAKTRDFLTKFIALGAGSIVSVTAPMALSPATSRRS